MSTEEKQQSARRSSFLTSHQIIDSTELELLGRWFEICNNYSHLHHLSFEYYRKVNYFMMLPIMLITTVTGSFNLVLSFHPTLIYIQIVLGVLGLFAGMISSMYNFLEIPQLQEKHNLHSSQFEKYGRTIEMELVLYKNISKTDYVYNTLGSVPKELRDKYNIVSISNTEDGKKRVVFKTNPIDVVVPAGPKEG